MLLFAGHYAKKQGAINETTSEFLEASFLCSMIANSCQLTYLDSTCTKKKLETIRTKCDSLSIEIHFLTTSEVIHGPVVYHQNDIQSIEAANILQNTLNKRLGFNNKPVIGWYHGKEEFGLDYFLKSNQPSIIVNIEHWNNYKQVKEDREKYAGAIAEGLNNIRSF